MASIGDRRMLAFTTKGSVRYDRVDYGPSDVFVFGAETAGLPGAILAAFTDQCRVRLPMRPENRSLNLSNAVAVAVFEAWRQAGFTGASA